MNLSPEKRHCSGGKKCTKIRTKLMKKGNTVSAHFNQVFDFLLPVLIRLPLSMFSSIRVFHLQAKVRAQAKGYTESNKSTGFQQKQNTQKQVPEDSIPRGTRMCLHFYLLRFGTRLSFRIAKCALHTHTPHVLCLM